MRKEFNYLFTQPIFVLWQNPCYIAQNAPQRIWISFIFLWKPLNASDFMGGGQLSIVQRKSYHAGSTFQTSITEQLFVTVVHSALAAHMKSLQNQKLIFINKIKPELNFGIIGQELHLILEESQIRQRSAQQQKPLASRQSYLQRSSLWQQF